MSKKKKPATTGNPSTSIRWGRYRVEVEEAVGSGRYSNATDVIYAGLWQLFRGPASFPLALQAKLMGLAEATGMTTAELVEMLLDKFGQELRSTKKKDKVP